MFTVAAKTGFGVCCLGSNLIRHQNIWNTPQSESAGVCWHGGRAERKRAARQGELGDFFERVCWVDDGGERSAARVVCLN